jgi:hypothetical protein
MRMAGGGGGLWCLCNNDVWMVKVLRSSNQYVHMEVSWRHETHWYLTVVYVSPHVARRQMLWDDLEDIVGTITSEWAVIFCLAI